MNKKLIIDENININTDILLDIDFDGDETNYEIELGEGEKFVKAPPSREPKKETPANRFQLETLDRLGVDYKPGLSFAEAKMLIENGAITKEQKQFLSSYMPVPGNISRKKANIYINYFLNESKSEDNSEVSPAIRDFLFDNGLVKKHEKVTVRKWRELSRTCPVMPSEVYRADRYGYILPDPCTHMKSRQIYFAFLGEVSAFLQENADAPVEDEESTLCDVIDGMELEVEDMENLSRQECLKDLLEQFTHDSIYEDTARYIMANPHVQKEIIVDIVSGYDAGDCENANDFQEMIMEIVKDDITRNKFFRIYMSPYQKYLRKPDDHNIVNDIMDYCCNYFPQNAEDSDEWHEDFEEQLCEFLKNQHYWVTYKSEQLLQGLNVDIKDYRLAYIAMSMIAVLPWATFTSKGDQEIKINNLIEMLYAVFSR